MKEEKVQLRDSLSRGFAKALGTEVSPEITSYVETGSGSLPGTCKLLAWDANSVKSFVFGTTNAAAIRGASDLLATLDDDHRKGKGLDLEPEQVLYAGGGSGLAVVAPDQVGPVIDELHRRFAREIGLGTCCAVAVDLAGGDGTFAKARAATQDEMARERVRRGSGVQAATPFFAVRCQVCGQRAASRLARRLGGRRAECEICHHHIEKGKIDRHEKEEITDFELIADARRGGFLAVLYADGNGIGSRIADLTSPLAFAEFSRAIDEVMSGSFETVAERYKLVKEKDAVKGPGRGHAYQVTICGGDDLVAILPGEVGVSFARDLLHAIETAAEEHEVLGKGIGAAAGVAIGKKGFPIRHLLDEAEDLLDSAKRLVYKTGVRSALDFAEVTDGSPRRESSIPARLDAGRKDKLLDTGRPYSLPEIQRFSERFEIVRDRENSLGRSQLHLLRRYARNGPEQLRNHVLYQVGRREGWRKLIARWATSADENAQGGLSEDLSDLRKGPPGSPEVDSARRKAVPEAPEVVSDVKNRPPGSPEHLSRRRKAHSPAVVAGENHSDVLADPDKVFDQVAPIYATGEAEHRVFDLADMIELWDHWPEDGRGATP